MFEMKKGRAMQTCAPFALKRTGMLSPPRPRKKATVKAAFCVGLVDKNATFIHYLVINNLFQYFIRKKVKHLLLSNHWGLDCNRCITL